MYAALDDDPDYDSIGFFFVLSSRTMLNVKNHFADFSFVTSLELIKNNDRSHSLRIIISKEQGYFSRY